MDCEFRQILLETLRRGENLPSEWVHHLFPQQKREYELVYKEKTREEDILAETMAVPLQPVRAFGDTGDEWHNMLIFGDNLQVLKTLLEMKKAGEIRNSDGTPGIRLIYIDPPFATKREFVGNKEQQAYQDKVSGSKFLEFLRKRLVLLKELLSDDGTLVVHLDIRKGHYVKVLLDEIFGENNFRNEIIWKRTGARSDSKTYNHIHDNLFLYTKGSQWVWNVQHTPYSDDYVNKFFTDQDEKGPFRKTILTAPGIRNGSSGRPWRGIDPTAKRRHWAIPGYVRYLLPDPEISDVIEALEELDKIGRVVWPAKKGGVPSFKQYLHEMDGVEIQSIWTDIRPIAANALEATHYPTQKPELLLSRIISSSSNKGDLVLDAFAGSGTTLAVAEKLKRRWIGIDCGKLSIYTIQKRMLNLRGEIGNNEKPLKPKRFTLYNAGLYDFSTLKKLPWEDWRFFALQLFGCKDQPHTIGGLSLDGKLKGASVLVFNHVGNFNKRIDEDTIRDIHYAIGSKVENRFFIIAPKGVFDFQQDYIDMDEVRYYALRIPYSVISELHYHEFTALQQPNDERSVNDTVDAVGFDFIRPPLVEWSASIKKRKGKSAKEAVLKIDSFESHARLRKDDVFGGLDTFSLLLLDFDYNGEVFEIDAVYFAQQLQDSHWEVCLNTNNLGENLMAVFIDIYGNEAQEIIPRSKFGQKSTN